MILLSWEGIHVAQLGLDVLPFGPANILGALLREKGVFVS